MSKVYLEREAICENCKNKDSCFPYPEMRAKCPVYKTLTADVEPVRHGEWKKHNGYVECSLCGTLDYNPSNHCGHCGAKMDGGNSDDNQI